MHILFVTGEYPPMNGGVGAYTAEVARALGDLGARVSVLTSVASTPAAADGRVAVFPVVEMWGASIWEAGARMADALGADWLHVQYQTAAFAMNPAINLAPARWRMRRKRRWRTAWTYHDLLVPYLFPKAGERLRTWITERPALAADLTIVTDEADRLQLASRLPHVEQIPIGSNITGLHLADDERASVRARYGYTSAHAVLGYFGFLNRSKGAVTLVHTLYRLTQSGLDVHLLMVGDPLGASDPSNRACLAEVEALIGELGLTERVRWTGRLGDAAVAVALNAVDVLVLPFEDGASLRRGTLMAGLANGCAIVTTTPAAPLPELVDGRDLLFVPPGDAAAAADAVRTLLSDPLRAAGLRDAARERSALFAWPAIARRHLELYAGPNRRL